MAIVQDRLNANKPPTPVPDAKSGKLAPGQINNNRDLEVDPKKEEPSFFGSFFSSAKKGQPKKAGPIMEAVRPPRIPKLIVTYSRVC
jgi:hypothetical protein